MRVVVCDDHPLARTGIVSILSENNKIREIEETSNIQEALSAINKEKPDVAIVDLKLGKEDGLEVIAYGKVTSPETKFIILTSFISQIDFNRAEKIGVDAYILKEAIPEDIIYVVDLAIRGKKYYDPDIIKYYTKSYDDNNQIGQLTEREKDVLQELAKGLSNEEIAGLLYISQNTVKKHISSILSKLNFKHRTQAAVYVKNMEG